MIFYSLLTILPCFHLSETLISQLEQPDLHFLSLSQLSSELFATTNPDISENDSSTLYLGV